jgi:hypothetical protein
VHVKTVHVDSTDKERVWLDITAVGVFVVSAIKDGITCKQTQVTKTQFAHLRNPNWVTCLFGEMTEELSLQIEAFEEVGQRGSQEYPRFTSANLYISSKN